MKKFSSQDNIPPRLTVLGGGEWKSTKKKVKAKIKDAARELIPSICEKKICARIFIQRGFDMAEGT